MRNYTIEHLNSITLKHSGQMCSNDHFYQTTNANFPKQIPTQSLLSNATSNHFFDSQMKKTRLKQYLQNFMQRQNAKKNKEQCIKSKTSLR